MQQYNISFDSIFGRIIDPIVYPFMDKVLNPYVGTGVKLPSNIYSTFLNISKAYVQRLEPQNKGEYTQRFYFILCHLLHKLIERNYTIQELMVPKTRDQYLTLKLFFVPLLDLVAESHKLAEEYNTFSHDYLLNGHSDMDHIFVIENSTEPKMCIKRILVNEWDSYLKTNGYSFNLAGTVMFTHENKLGIFADFLTEVLALRKSYKDKRNTFPEGSEDYKFYDMRQLAVKVVANTTYGLMGMSTFRYSDKWVAKTITVCGRLTLKISQICGELYLAQVVENNND